MQAQTTHLSSQTFPVVVNNWRDMINILKDEGYTVTKVSRVTGVPRRSVQRWFNGAYEFPNLKLFAGVLYIYCHIMKKRVRLKFYKIIESD